MEPGLQCKRACDFQAGPTGSQFGILACLFIEVVHNWYIISRPDVQIGKLSGYLLALFLVGLLPMVVVYCSLAVMRPNYC